MKVEFDDAKNKANIAKHGISLERATEFEVQFYDKDDRREYGEARYRAWGLVDGEYYHLAFTIRDGAMRVISLRRAHKKEIRRYVT